MNKAYIIIQSMIFLAFLSMPVYAQSNNFNIKIISEKHGLTEHELIFNVQNLADYAKDFNLGLFINSTSFSIDKLNNIYIEEHKPVLKEFPVYSIRTINKICYDYNNKTFENKSYDCSYNETYQSGTEFKNVLAWKSAKSLLLKTDADLKQEYGLIQIPKLSSKCKYDDFGNSYDCSGTKRFRITWHTPIEKFNNGWGSSGYYELYDSVSKDVLYDPWWNVSYNYKQQINLTNTLAYLRENASVEFNVSKTYTRSDCKDIAMTNSTENGEITNFTISNTADNCTVKFYDNWAISGTNVYYAYYNCSSCDNSANWKTVPYEVIWRWNQADVSQFQLTEAGTAGQCSIGVESGAVDIDGTESANTCYYNITDWFTYGGGNIGDNYILVANTSKESTPAGNEWNLGDLFLQTSFNAQNFYDMLIFRLDQKSYIRNRSSGTYESPHTLATIIIHGTWYYRKANISNGVVCHEFTNTTNTYSHCWTYTNPFTGQPAGIGSYANSQGWTTNISFKNLHGGTYKINRNFTTVLGSEESRFEITPPTYSDNTTNENTYIGELTIFNLTWVDETALETAGQYIFSSNNSGTWINATAVNFTSTPENATSSLYLNATVGTVVSWCYYARDNIGNWNNTNCEEENQFFLTTTRRDYITEPIIVCFNIKPVCVKLSDFSIYKFNNRNNIIEWLA